MTFHEILRQIVAVVDALEHDDALSVEERAALVLVGCERFDRLRHQSPMEDVLKEETR